MKSFQMTLDVCLKISLPSIRYNKVISKIWKRWLLMNWNYAIVIYQNQWRFPHIKTRLKYIRAMISSTQIHHGFPFKTKRKEMCTFDSFYINTLTQEEKDQGADFKFSIWDCIPNCFLWCSGKDSIKNNISNIINNQDYLLNDKEIDYPCN